MYFGATERRTVRYLVMVILVLVVGIGLSVYIRYSSQQASVRSMIGRVETIASFVSPELIAQLPGKETDIELSVYQSFKRSLMDAQTAQRDSRFVYVVGRTADNTVFFFGDSEPTDSRDYSPPGQIYSEADPAMIATFSEGKSRVSEAYTDRWGRWVSAYAPVLSADGKTVVALVGLDVPAHLFQQSSLWPSLIPVLVTIVILTIIIGSWVASSKHDEVQSVRLELVALASHEIRGPLTGMKWAVDALSAERSKLSESAQSMITTISDTVGQLSETVSELLDQTAVMAGQKFDFERVQIAEVLTKSVRLLDAHAKHHNVRIEVDQSAFADLACRADVSKLSRVLYNLLANGIKYSHPAGIVTVSGKTLDNWIEISVTDRGIGIPAGEQVYIFSHLYRATNARRTQIEGTGLGLFYCNEVVKRHGGMLSFISKENEGTTFVVRLPKA